MGTIMDCKPIETREGCYTPIAGALPQTIFIRTEYGVNAAGNPIIVAVRYTDSAGVPIAAATALNVKPGACCCNTQPDVFRTTQALAAGDNIIVHNLGFAPVEVEVRDAITGSEVSVRVRNETANTVTLTTAVPMQSVRISIDA